MPRHVFAGRLMSGADITGIPLIYSRSRSVIVDTEFLLGHSHFKAAAVSPFRSSQRRREDI